MATKKNKLIWSLIILGCIILLSPWLWPLLEAPRVEPLYWCCQNNQKQIVMALHNYYSKYHKFPPAYVTDKNGKPLYSWRVLILPFIEETRLYNQFHLDESWDSPHNKKLSETEIGVFHCQGHRGPEKGRSNHVLVTGPGTIWEDEEKPLSCKAFWKKSQPLLMLVEIGEPGVHWAEPKDLKIDDIDSAFLNEDGTFKTSNGYWTYGSWYLNFRAGKTEYWKVTASFTDGYTKRLSQEELLAMIEETLKAGEEKQKKRERELP